MTLYQVWHWKGCVTCCCRTWTEWSLNIRRHIKLAPSPQHLKQEKRKSREKRGKGWSSQLVKTEEKEHALFSVPWEEYPLQRTLSRTYLVFPNWKQLIVKSYICLPQRQTRRHACAIFAGQTASAGKPSWLSATSSLEGEWTYNCLIGQYISTNGLFGTSYVFSWIWPCNGYLNYRNFMPQINSFARKNWQHV